MQTGTLTVTGEGETELPLRGWPREVVVVFRQLKDPVPCDPHHHNHDEDGDGDDDKKGKGHHKNRDKLSHHIRHEDEDQRHHNKPGHKHQDRKFFLEIKWKVTGIREIDWFVFY